MVLLFFYWNGLENRRIENDVILSGVSGALFWKFGEVANFQTIMGYSRARLSLWFEVLVQVVMIYLD